MFDFRNNANVLKALPYCVHLDSDVYSSAGCPACPFSEDCSRIGPSWVNDGLIRILSSLPPSDQRNRFIHVLSVCNSCEQECYSDCPYYAEFGEFNSAAYYRKIYSFLKDSEACSIS